MNKEEETTSENAEALNIQINNDLPPTWVDYIVPMAREDGIFFLRFATIMPEGLVEQARIITDNEVMKQFVDSICSAMDYYPGRQDGE
ncbi:MAG: hypothetical protein K9J83_01340 [Desulfarculaceae bacterium]|nr:hypothetical protein [Desulfarculaceae bacterium]